MSNVNLDEVQQVIRDLRRAAFTLSRLLGEDPDAVRRHWEAFRGLNPPSEHGLEVAQAAVDTVLNPGGTDLVQLARFTRDDYRASDEVPWTFTLLPGNQGQACSLQGLGNSPAEAVLHIVQQINECAEFRSAVTTLLERNTGKRLLTPTRSYG